MSPSGTDPETAASQPRARRERSMRYPGVSLAEAIKFAESVANLGVDGFPATDIASALGYKNIKTNTFSAPLSAARQFGLLTLTGEGYALTPLAREILHPVEPSAVSRLYRQAFLKPPLYAELAERLGGKKVPDAAILGNVLYHHHQIIASAKQVAADVFLESARFAGTLGADAILYPEGRSAAASTPPPTNVAPAADVRTSTNPATVPRPPANTVRLDLRLWDADLGKTIRLRAPVSITPASFERFLQAFRLIVRVEDPSRQTDPGD